MGGQTLAEGGALQAMAAAPSPREFEDIGLVANPSGQFRLTIARKITRARARKTIERLFMSDLQVARAIRRRAAHFVAISSRRGGRIWIKHPNKIHPALLVGDYALIRATPQAVRDLGSVAHFLYIGRVIAPKPVAFKTPYVGVNSFDSLSETTVGGILGSQMLPHFRDYQDQPKSTADSVLKEKASKTPDMPVILQKVLHWQVGEKPTHEVLALVKERQVTRIFIDRLSLPAASTEELVADAERLFDFVSTLGMLKMPVIVGPITEDDNDLAILLARNMIGSTRYSYNDYCASVEQHNAFLKIAAESRAPLPGGIIPPSPNF